MDEIVEAIASALMLAHIVAFIWAGFLRKGIAPVLALNILVSAAVVVYWALRISELFKNFDIVQAFVGLELIVLGTSLLAVSPIQVLRSVIWIEFAAHALLVAAALAFMLTFKMTRLI